MISWIRKERRMKRIRKRDKKVNVGMKRKLGSIMVR
jgi:hypothetical protein